MKLRTLGLALSLPLMCLVGCEDGDTPEDETVAVEGEAAAPEGEAAAPEGEAAAPEGEAAEAAGPDCAALIEAIKAKNVEGVVAASAEGAADVVTAESIEALAGALGAGECGEAAVEGEAATVPVTIGETSKDLKFVKAGDEWKFDAKGYFAANPAPAPEEKGKKKKGKKKKGKKKKKK